MATTKAKKRTGIFISNIGLIIGMLIGAIGSWLIGSNLPSIILWVIIGGALGRLIHFSVPKNKNTDGATIQLHEERLSISKDSVKTAEVSIHKEIINEVKHMAIPVKREELVIQKKMIDLKNDKDINTETFRIPISEEQIDIIKQPKALNDVTVYKNSFQDHKNIKETLKKEKVHVSSAGNPIIVDNTPDDSSNG